MARQADVAIGSDQTRKRIIIYLLSAFGIAWILAFAVVWPLYHQAGTFDTVTQLATAGCMFAPTLGVVVARLVTHEGFGNSWLKPQSFKTTWKYYALGWLGPLALVIVGVVAWFLINPSDFDPQMNAYYATVQSQLEAAGQAGTVTHEQMLATMPLQMLTMLAAPLLNFIPSLGEEWGWRGYLLPKLLKRHSMGVTLLLSGVIWGIWHAPLIMIGHNYGTDYLGFPVLGILAMCVLCIVLGIFMSYVTLRSGSCLPAALAHGMFNGSYSFGIVFSASGGNPFFGPAATGVIGGFAFIIMAVIMACALIRRPQV